MDWSADSRPGRVLRHLGGDPQRTRAPSRVRAVSRGSTLSLIRFSEPAMTLGVSPRPIYRVGDLIVDTGRSCASRDGVEIPLPGLSFDLLLALIEAAPDFVTANELVERVWAGRVVSPETLTQRVKLLRSALGDDARHPRYIAVVRSRGYRLLAEVAPTRPFLVEDSGNSTAQASPCHPEPLLAVLPFENLSDDTELLYFSDGVSEEILQTVARTTGLRVIGRSSSFQFRGANKAVRNVVGELNATHILDGSVRRSGRQLRISAQLIDCASQTTLWSHRFERQISDVFALQDEIAGAVAHALRLAFSPSVQMAPIDPIAFDLYLRARTGVTTYVGAYNAELLEAAVVREPRLAAAWATLAMSLAIEAQDAGRVTEPLPEATVADLRLRAGRAAGKALELDPDAPLAHAALAALEPVAGAFARSHAHLTRALATTPDEASVLMRMGRWYRAVGRELDSQRIVARAYEIDPLNPSVANDYAAMLVATGRVDEGRAIGDANRNRWPEIYYVVLSQLFGATYLAQWDWVDRLTADIRARGPHIPYVLNRLTFAEQLRRHPHAAGKDLLATLRRSLAETGTISINVAVQACRYGSPTETREVLERASFDHLFRPGGRLLPGDYGLHGLYYGLLREIQRDPWFVSFCGRFGLCDYWVETDEWPDCAERLSAYYDFKAEARRLVASASERIHQNFS